MNRNRYKLTCKSLAGLIITLGHLGNVAVATPSYFNNLDTQCTTLNGAGSVRNSSVSCTTCHNNSYVKNSTGSIYANAGHKPTSAISSILCSLTAKPNTPPTANAGLDQSVTGVLPVTITLNGTGTDKEGDKLTFKWSFTKKPSGSKAALSSTNAAAPAFSADLAGQYQLQLVVNDGKVNSPADTVVITIGTSANTAPVAHAGLDQHVLPGTGVKLNGSGTDANNDPLTYAWTLQVPTGSTATLLDATAIMPTFTADMSGLYVATLVVNDGKANSAPDSVNITAGTGNTAPVASAGLDQNVVLGATVTLNGSGIDAELDPLTYKWSLIKKPTDSLAALANPTLAKPIFVADKIGEYVAQLIVNDGTLDSHPDTVLVKANQPSVNDINVNLMLNVMPATLTLEEFGKSVAIQTKVTILDNVERLNIPVLINISVIKPNGIIQAIEQKRILMKDSYKLYERYTPKMAGLHTINVVISDQSGKTLAQQSKDLTVELIDSNDDDDDQDDDHGHDDDHDDD